MEDAELKIKIGIVSATIKPNNLIRLSSENNLFSIVVKLSDLETIIEEAKTFYEYKGSRIARKEHKKPCSVEWNINFDNDSGFRSMNLKELAKKYPEIIVKYQGMKLQTHPDYNNYFEGKKQHQYQFDVPLKPELVWYKWGKPIPKEQYCNCPKCRGIKDLDGSRKEINLWDRIRNTG